MKSVAFLYINNETEEREIKELIPFTIAPKIIRYLGINLIKEAKDLYSENYRTFIKERKTQRNGKTFHVHGLEKQILLKCLWYLEQSIHSVQSLSKYHQLFFHRAGIINPKICMEPEKTPSQRNAEKENQRWGVPGWHSS